jgi:MoaA/NifB/PqqE/SkfB family radical SAM enzyme
MVQSTIDFSHIGILRDREILASINLDEFEYSAMTWPGWIEQKLRSLHRPVFDDHQRLVFYYHEDYYTDHSVVGKKIKCLQEKLNLVDISNFFCVIISSNPALDQEIQELKQISTDPTPLGHATVAGSYNRSQLESKRRYSYSSPEPVGVSLDSLSPRHQYLLSESQYFCMYPWTHLHAWPTGEVWPCCMADSKPGPLGNSKTQELKMIWNGDKMKQLRLDMLNEKPNDLCVRCYEKEQSGFFSGRRSANKHQGHHISKIDSTGIDGSVEDFQMVYWDIRFSNLCNLRCRTCGYIFSSQWWKDQKKLMGEWGDKWARETPVLNYAGRHETDMWEQMMPHLDYVEQIYFAGGEPLLMEEHYLILDELVRRERFDVRLIYNTNFTETRLKDRLVFEYWKKFDSVSVGASLDAMGPRAEYIRKGTDWYQIESNREKMLEICPDVDFYVSPTLSILNAYHISEFHRDWTQRGLIQAQDLNVNILQDPLHYRIDVATQPMKLELSAMWKDHLDWLEPQDSLKRATNGFKSAISFLNNIDNSHMIPVFWAKTNELDAIRNERLLDHVPELKALQA